MSLQSNIITIEPSYGKEERFTSGPYNCPRCHGRGEFMPDEVGRGEYQKNLCHYCAGTGKLIAHITVKWNPVIAK